MNPTLRSATRQSSLRIALAVSLGASSAFADTITTAVDVRTVFGSGNGSADANLSLYNSGTNVQYTWLNFDLSAYSGQAITSDVTLTLKAQTFSGAYPALTGVTLGTANTAWTFAGITDANKPATTTVADVTNPSGSFTTGQSVTWTIPSYEVEKWATEGYLGLALKGGSGSTLHFDSSRNGGTPTLTLNGTTATDGTWSGGNGNWTDSANWAATTIAQGIGKSATINGGTAVNITMDANRSVGSLSFSGANHTISGGSGKLALNVTSGSPTVSVEAARTATISAAVVGIDGLTKSGDGNLTLTGANALTGTTTISAGTLQIGNGGATGSLSSLNVVNNGAFSYNIAGAAVNVNKTISGTGTANVTGNQSVNFANGTTISTGGSQTYSATATTGRYYGFNLDNNAIVTLASSAGNIAMTGYLGTADNHTGNLNINTNVGNGSVTLNTPVGVSGVDYGLNSLTVNAGTGAITLGTYNGQGWGIVNAISLTGGAINSTAILNAFTTLTVTNSSDGTFSGNLSGGSVVKQGAGALTLSGGTTNYTGGIAINGGQVIIDSDAKLGAASGAVSLNGGTIKGSAAITLGAARTITLGASGGYFSNGYNQSWTINSKLTGAGFIGLNYDSSASNSMTLASTTNDYSGETRIGTKGPGFYDNPVAAAILKLGATNALPYGTGKGNVIVGHEVNGTTVAQLDLNGFSANINGLSTNNAAYSTVNNSGATAATLTLGNGNANGSFGGVIRNTGGALRMEKAGSGTQTLSNANTYTGTTTVSGGTLVLQGGGGAGTDYTGGNLAINGASTLRISGPRYNFNGKTFTFDNVGGGTLDAVADGVGGFVFTGGNTFTTSGGAQNTISGSGAGHQGFNLNGQTATFDVAVGSDPTVANLHITGKLWNSGNIVKEGAGTLTLSEDNSYTGTTLVSEGTLLVNGDHTNGGLINVTSGATLGGGGTVRNVTITDGKLSPGNSAGHFIVNDLILTSLSILDFELGAPTETQVAGSDFVTVGGTLTLGGGTLKITGISGFNPAAGNRWLLMTAGGGVDNGSPLVVDTVNSTPPLPGLSYVIDATSTPGNVYLQVVPEAGTSALMLLGAALLLRRRANRRP